MNAANCSGVSPTGSETAVELRESDAFVRHAYLPGVMPGQRYGFRAHGPYAPERGLRCNSAKLLLSVMTMQTFKLHS